MLHRADVVPSRLQAPRDSPVECRPCPRAGGPRDADDGAIRGDQGRQSGQPAVLPDGRFLRIVLRGRGNREPGARNRAHQAGEASGAGHSHVRRACGTGRRLPAAPDRPRPSGRRVRADRGSRGSEETRPQIRRAPRRGAPRHPGHDHRGAPAGAGPGQLPARHRPPPRLRYAILLRARGRRHIHRSFCPERDGRNRPFRRDRPLRAARDPGAGRDPRRSGPEKLLAGDAGLDHAAPPRRPRSGFRRAAAKRLFRGRDPRRLRRLQPGRDHGGRQRALLHREDADRQPSDAQPALPRHLRRGACHRCGDPRQPGTHPDPVRASGQAACSPPSIAR